MRLTDLEVRKATVKQTLYKINDGGGLYLHIHPNGSKYWRFRYKRNAVERQVGLGVYPQITLTNARQAAAEARKQLAEGRDPLLEKKRTQIKKKDSFENIAREWHEKNIAKWSPKHSDTILTRLEEKLFPVVGRTEIGLLKPMDILIPLRKVEAAGNLDTARRLLQYCTLIFRYAIVTDRIDYNPAQDLTGALKVYKQKNLPTIPADKLPRFLRQLNALDASMMAKIATKLLILTFVRQGELRRAEWSHISFKAAVWEFPAENMKMKKLHLVPLTEQMIALLKELKRINPDSKYLFPNRTGTKKPIMSENTINGLIAKTSFKGKLVAHGFRALASTALNEKGFRADVIEKQLSHEEKNLVRAAYNRAEYIDERRDMMVWWSNHVASCGEL